MKHIHHIIPRHAGGTDDLSNLIELSVEEHADAHRKLYEQYGREEDRMAWLALSGQASKTEICVLGYKLGRKKTDIFLENKYGSDWRSILGKLASARSAEVINEKMQSDESFAKRARENAKKASDAALSSVSIEKRKETFKVNKHQQGNRNNNFGNCWIHNLTLKQNKLIKASDPIPDGWVKGRKMKF